MELQIFKKHLTRYILLFFNLAALGLLSWWFFNDPVKNFTVSVPGMDNRKKGAAVAGKPVIIGTF